MFKERPIKDVANLQIQAWYDENNPFRREIVAIIGLLVRYGQDNIPAHMLHQLIDSSRPDYQKSLDELFRATNSLLGEEILPLTELAS